VPLWTANYHVVGSASETATDFATVAYAPSGSRLWVDRFDGPTGGFDQASALAVDPRSGVLYVTGTSESQPGPTGALDATTVAYGA
jgi:hypothetical protein